MLELYVVKATRTVPRRERGSNSPYLADKVTRTVPRRERGSNSSDLADIAQAQFCEGWGRETPPT